MNNATTQSHIVWLDVIRTVAMLMVIGVHCIDPFYIFYGPPFLFSL